ncbi:hypothetical protein F5Y09DRAFT_806 [Xylaria sp. FL1042]|nr:hypothetical protein F5Y09DRAFT_806 [Xylaria sp. FL1042]
MRTLGISFWKNALLHIDKGIKALEIFCCDTDGRLKSINSLRTLDHDYLDKDGNLLSNDLPLALYLSQKYDIKDLVSLELYGLQSLTYGSTGSAASRLTSLSSYNRRASVLGRVEYARTSRLSNNQGPSNPPNTEHARHLTGIFYLLWEGRPSEH